MKRMKRKEQFIDVIGTWTGEDGDEVTQWLDANGYKYAIQREDDEALADRIKQETAYLAQANDTETKVEDEARVRLVIVGPRLWEQWNMDRGDVLTMRHRRDEQRLTVMETDHIDSDYTDI